MLDALPVGNKQKRCQRTLKKSQVSVHE